MLIHRSAEGAKSFGGEKRACPNPCRPYSSIWFSAKESRTLITPAIEPELHPYMAKIFRALKSPSLTIDGTADHVHILFALSRVIKIADLVEEVKTESSKWIKTKGTEFGNFHWQAGYGAFQWDNRRSRP